VKQGLQVNRESLRLAFLFLVGVIFVPCVAIADEESERLRNEYVAILSGIEVAKKKIPQLCGFDRNRMLTTIRDVKRKRMDDDSGLSLQDIELAADYTRFLGLIERRWKAVSFLYREAAGIHSSLAGTSIK